MNDELEVWIDDAAKSVQSKPPGLAAGLPSFCEYWPVARPVLESLKKYLPKFAPILALIVIVGDKVCGVK